MAGITAVFGFLFIVIFSHLLSPFDFGLLSTFTIIITGLAALTDWGFTVAITKFISTAYYSDNKKLSNYITYLFSLKLSVTTLVVVITLYLSQYLAPTVLHDSKFAYIFQFAAITAWFYAMILFIESFITTINKYELTTLASLFLNISKLIIPYVILLFFIRDISGVVIGVLIAIIISTIFYLLNFISIFKEYLHINFQKCDEFTIYLTFASGFVLLSFLDVFDVMLLNYFRSPIEVAFYKAALTVITATAIFITAIKRVFWTSLMEKEAKRLFDSQRRLAKLMIAGCLIFGIILTAIIFLFSQSILGIFFPSEYIAADLTLKILALAITPSLLNSIGGMVLLSKSGYVKKFFYLSLTTLIIDNIFNVLTIPIWGSAGAAGSTVLMDFLNSIIIMKWTFEAIR